MLFWTFLLFFVSSVFSAPLWGNDGHKITGWIATQLLNQSVLDKCNDILNGDSLADVATWADECKHEDAYDWSGSLHYINTPDWQCYFDYQADCYYNDLDDWCVASAIQNYSRRLVTQQDPTQVNEALKFLVHFVGDIHQPLYVGFASDYGGNKQKGHFVPTGHYLPLHGVWDYEAIEYLEEQEDYRNYQDYAQQLYRNISVEEQLEWSECKNAGPICQNEWATQSASLSCTNAYVYNNGTHIENGFYLGYDYYERNILIINEQLKRGGVRLASILNYLLG